MNTQNRHNTLLLSMYVFCISNSLSFRIKRFKKKTFLSRENKSRLRDGRAVMIVDGMSQSIDCICRSICRLCVLHVVYFTRYPVWVKLVTCVH